VDLSSFILHPAMNCRSPILCPSAAIVECLYFSKTDVKNGITLVANLSRILFP
jgi:hypothetical protein